MITMMGLSVLHPGLLIAGLLCVAIPILVHLLRRKHRPISWGAMRFLEQAYRKRRRLITIEQLLLLLTRCAIVALIAGAVGSLVRGSGLASQKARTVVIVLDNSIHSGALLESGESTVEYQKQRAIELLDSLDSTRGDRAALITAAAPAMGEAVPATSELGLIRSRIDGVRATDAERDLDGAIGLVSEVLSGIEGESIIQPVFFLGMRGWDRDASHNEHAIDGVDSILLDSPPASSDANTAIVDIQPLRPMVTRRDDKESYDEIQGIRVVLQRSDPSFSQSTGVLIHDTTSDVPLASVAFVWRVGQERMTQTIPLDQSKLIASRGGSALVRVTIDDEDVNPRDNSRLVGLPIRQHIGVGIIDSFTLDAGEGIRPSRWVRAVLGADEGFVSIQQINARSAGDRIDPTLDILFVLAPSALDDSGWDRIARLNAGGMPIVITPDASPDALDWVSHLESLSPGIIAGEIRSRSFDPPIGLANELESDGLLLDGIRDEYPDLASSVTVSRRLNLEPGADSGVLLRDVQGHPLALVSRSHDSDRVNSAGGSVVLSGVALDAQWTDLPARPFFVAMMHELVHSLLARSIAPDSRIAGAQSSGLVFDSLERLVGDGSDPRIAGAYVRVDQQGTGKRAVIVNPDASHTAAETATLETPLAGIERSLPGMDIEELSTVEDLSADGFGHTSDPGRSIALWLFGIAAVLGVVELLLARLCSYRAVESHGLEPRGAA